LINGKLDKDVHSAVVHTVLFDLSDLIAGHDGAACHP
tara:strand:- start:288 stop:398 length:111 start_codon:yes stop_codon:yes gene_type:complete